MQQERQAAGKIKAGHKRTLQQFPCQKEAEELEYPAGLKWTRQRKLVYKILWEAKEPLNAAQIYHLAEKEAAGEEYALSTVYRFWQPLRSWHWWKRQPEWWTVRFCILWSGGSIPIMQSA